MKRKNTAFLASENLCANWEVAAESMGLQLIPFLRAAILSYAEAAESLPSPAGPHRTRVQITFSASQETEIERLVFDSGLSFAELARRCAQAATEHGLVSRSAAAG